MQTFEGKVRGGEVHLRRATLKRGAEIIDGDPLHTPFVLQRDGLPDLKVELAPNTRVYPEQTIGGRYQEVEESGFAAAFRGRAPGPHVDIELRGVLVEGGDEIVIYGSPVFGNTAGDEGYREAAEQVVIGVVAEAIGVGRKGRSELSMWLEKRQRPQQRGGPEAEASFLESARSANTANADPRGERVPLPWLTLGLSALFAVAAIGMLATMPSKMPGMALLMWALGLLATFVYQAKRRRFLPLFVAKEKKGRGLIWGARMIPKYLGYLLVPVLVGCTFFLLWGESGAYFVGTFVIALLLLYACLEDWLVTGGPRRELKNALDAEPSRLDGSWGFAEGKIQHGSFEVSCQHSVSSTAASVYHDSDGGLRTRSGGKSWRHYENIKLPATELALSVDGKTLRVQPEDAIFSGTEFRNRGQRINTSYGSDAPVMVVGRIDKQGEALSVSATGPGSLYIIGGESSEVRSELKGRLLRDRMGYLAAIATAVGIGALAFIMPFESETALGVVTSDSSRELAPGTACDVKLYLVSENAEEGTSKRRASIRCGGEQLSGGAVVWRHFVECRGWDCRALDADRGDPNLRIDSRSVMWRQNERAVDIEFTR